VRYDASRATLTKVPGSMLATMFGARLDMLKSDPEDGSVFIDRDGERFGLVLDFLRDGEASQLAKTITELPTEPQREAMLLELEFFGLADAVFPRPWFEGAEFRAWRGELTSVRSWCAAVLHGRRVVVFGGFNHNDAVLNTTEVFDLDDAGATESSTAGPAMATARASCTAVRLDARRVLVVGGSSIPQWPAAQAAGYLDTTEILDLGTMLFSAGPRMLSKRCYCTAVALDAGRVLVAGGVGENHAFHRTTEILDVATMTFAKGPRMLSQRSACSAVALGENPRRVLIVGGRGPGNAGLNTTEVLDVDTMAFSPGPAMRTGRYACAAVLLGGSQQHCLVIGGHSGIIGRRVLEKTTEVLDLETMEFTGYGPAMLAGRGACVAVADDAGGRVFVIGGRERGIGVLEAAAA
jgi:hypothetical protein